MWSTLVDAEALAARLGDSTLRILDCRHKLVDPAWGPAQYALGHIPGAHHAHVDLDLSDPPSARTGRHPLPSPDRFRAACGRWGIDETTQVVVYDDAGGIWAARAWWLLKDYGHDAVALLDGGLQAWTRAGEALTQDPGRAKLSRFRGEPGHMPTRDAAAIQAALGSPDQLLLDARAPERFRGESEPIDAVAGHIPGAQNLPAVSLLAADGRLLAAAELRRRFQDLVAAPPDHVVAYCGSGVTGTHLVLAAEAAGQGRIALYPGSWSEWIRDPDHPIETGAARSRAGPKRR